MARGPWWAYGIVALAIAMFATGLVGVAYPPADGCGPGPDVYCHEEAYNRLKTRVLAFWSLAVALLAAGAALVAWEGRDRLPLRRRASRPPAGPTHAPDGRRLGVARFYEEMQRARR